MTLTRPAIPYLCVSLLLFVLSTLGADVYAAVRVEGETWHEAAVGHLGIQLGYPIQLIVSLLPFLFCGLLGAAIHRELGAPKAISVFAFLSLLMIYWYFRGYWFEHVYLKQSLWTAAALSLGFNIMKADALVLVACLARRWIIKRLT